MPVVNIYSSTEAREGILRRAAWEDQEMPARLLDSIERIFGERISPVEGVSRILRDIRTRGRRGRRGSARIDGNQPGIRGDRRMAGA